MRAIIKSISAMVALGVFPASAMAATPATERVVEPVREVVQPRIEPTPATLRTRKTLTQPVSVKMETVLRCERGVCLHVSSKTTVSGSKVDRDTDDRLDSD